MLSKKNVITKTTFIHELIKFCWDLDYKGHEEVEKCFIIKMSF